MNDDGEQRPELEDAGRATAPDAEAMGPGDEAPPGAALAGENLCRTCGGSGETDGKTCPECGGAGKTTSAISSGA